jgi:hypothetical protein
LARASARQSDGPEDGEDPLVDEPPEDEPVDESPEDESPEDESPEDESPEDESPEDESPEAPPSDFVLSDFVPSVPDSDPASAALLSPLELPFSSFARAARADVPRSFFAQPVPLKWTAGATNAFVMVPSAPHSGQNFGPWSLIPWMTSVVRRHLEQV